MPKKPKPARSAERPAPINSRTLDELIAEGASLRVRGDEVRARMAELLVAIEAAQALVQQQQERSWRDRL